MQEFKNMGRALQQRRIALKLTQVELAIKISTKKHPVHPQFISNYERGLCAPPEHCFSRLSTALQLGHPGSDLREEIWQAIAEDAMSVINKKYRDLI